MRQPSAPNGCELFHSAKSRSAIPLPGLCNLFEDALVQASLDPAVRTLAFLPAAGVPAAPVGTGIVVIERDDGRFWLDVEPARTLRTAEEAKIVGILEGRGVTPLVLTSEEILREPRFANSRRVWSYRDWHVIPQTRLQILDIIEFEGRMSLGELMAAIRGEGDPAPSVMTLACADLLELDLVSQQLGLTTRVRARSRR